VDQFAIVAIIIIIIIFSDFVIASKAITSFLSFNTGKTYTIYFSLQFYKNFCTKLENIIWKPPEGAKLPACFEQ